MEPLSTHGKAELKTHGPRVVAISAFLRAQNEEVKHGLKRHLLNGWRLPNVSYD